MDLRPESTGIEHFIGLDVQISRPCAYYVLGADRDYAGSGWLRGNGLEGICRGMHQLVASFAGKDPGSVAVGIDAPRVPLPAPRQYYWRGGKWVKHQGTERGYGRHCEVVVKALKIANPQWTPLAGEAPEWMELGFALFRSLTGLAQVYEVFPTASYRLLENSVSPEIQLSFESFGTGPKDMLDAAAAAFTLSELADGRGCQVGGGDGLGTIALPARLPVPDSHPVLTWPE